ncbi:MAG TPA: phospholipid carrier-dependent glycosyltransferase [Chthoniobacterales bacterium]|nr:phospholipid carrier-dependent glycosyltransferase [Chthoniobacterales bacterium]
MSESQSGLRGIHFFLLAIILIFGTFLRITPHAFSPGSSFHWLAPLHPQPAWDQIGFDEGLYREYVNGLTKDGLGSYPDMVQAYIDAQSKMATPMLPPVRFLYIFTGYIWKSIFGSETLEGLRQVAAVFSVLTLFLATAFAWRLRGPAWGCAVAALMAFAPTQIHMSQHALIDGFFTFWTIVAIWLLWENLILPNDWRRLVGFGVSLAILVITKENSCFVWLAMVTLIVANRWLKFGIATRSLLLVTVAGPLLGVVILVFLSGGLSNLIETYRLLVTKASVAHYAIMTGDGPWYRYLVDLMLVSPIVLILAIGAIFRLNRTMRPELYFVIFIAASYLIMCNVRNGMNLRYANIWDMPLRFLAVSCLSGLVGPMARYRNLVFGAAIALIAAVEFHQYIVLAVRYPLYELITHDLLQALHILKTQ